jgi:hypothetical protein
MTAVACPTGPRREDRLAAEEAMTELTYMEGAKPLASHPLANEEASEGPLSSIGCHDNKSADAITIQPVSVFRHPPRARFDDSNPDPFVRRIYEKNIKAEKLYETVRSIAEGRIIAAHYHHAFASDECRAPLEQIKIRGGCTPYEGAPDLEHLGMSLFETSFGVSQRQTYFDRALANIERVRALWGQTRFPLDMVRALLDEASPKGANLLRIDQRTCAAGLIRIQENGAAIAPHMDHAGWDVPDALEAQHVEAQLTVVIPLSVGVSGGETTIYPVRLSKPHYDANRLPPPFSYGVRDDVLPSLSVTLKPQVGDMMIWDARHLHRVSAVIGSPRTTLSFFIGVCRDGRLVIFS